MEKENEPKRTQGLERRNPPTEGKIALLRYHRRRLRQRYPRIKSRGINQNAMTTPLQDGGKSAV